VREKKKKTIKSCEVDGVMVESMDEAVNCKNTFKREINQKKGERRWHNRHRIKRDAYGGLRS
jgi:hypothetical protein